MKSWKKLALSAVALALILAWVGVAVGAAMGVSKTTWFVLVTIAAFATEGAFWGVAAVLGISVIQARGRIWAWLRRPFSGDA